VILCIDTGSEWCRVSLCKNNTESLVSAHSSLPNSHSATLLPLVRDLCSQEGLAPADIRAVALSAGPGSYTGLRIGSAAAKALAFSLNIPFIAISSLEILALHSLAFLNQNPEKKPSEPFVFLPLLDARRQEVYMATFQSSGNRIIADKPLVLEEKSPEEWLPSYAVLSGSGAPKTLALFPNHQLLFYPELVSPDSSVAMAKIALSRYAQQDFSNPKTFEPFYLKPFYLNTSPKI
jgi:tRNA threonylcarbamoyladenosine biosynthesis protein TsaB